MYGGYRFSPNAQEEMYSPFALFLSLDHGAFSDYWFNTGIPLYLVQAMQWEGWLIYDYLGMEVSLKQLTTPQALYKNLPALLYQTGFLTLGEPGKKKGTYKLRFPNKDVEHGFYHLLRMHYLSGPFGNQTYSPSEFHRLLAEGDPIGFMKHLSAYVWSSHFEIHGDPDFYYRNMLRVPFMVIDVPVEAKHPGATFRNELLVRMPGYVYRVQIRIDIESQVVPRRIDIERYPPTTDEEGNRLITIRIFFEHKRREIVDWKVGYPLI